MALSRLLDGLVDVLALGASTEGVDAALRDDLTAKLSGLLGGSDDERDVFAMYTVCMLLASPQCENAGHEYQAFACI